MAANPSISPSSSSSTSSLHRSFFTRSLSSSLFRTSLKLGFSSIETPRILSVRSMASNGDGFRSNSGEHQINTSKTAPSSSSTSSSAIDFLTLCNRLKTMGRFWMNFLSPQQTSSRLRLARAGQLRLSRGEN